MKTLIKTILTSLAIRTSKFALKILCLSVYFSSKAVVYIFGSIECVTSDICLRFGWVYFLQNPEPVGAEMIPTFNDDELKLMVQKIKNTSMTIQEIADHFSISYRQARKVKQSKDSRLDVRDYSSDMQR